jgi:predicted transcriptional regulator
MTKREVLNLIKTLVPDNGDVIAYCDNEIASLDKKNEYRKAHPVKSKTQKENEGLYPTILNILDEVPKSPTEIANTANLSVQKTSALLTKLTANGTIVKTVEKGKSYYSKVVA